MIMLMIVFMIRYLTPPNTEYREIRYSAEPSNTGIPPPQAQYSRYSTPLPLPTAYPWVGRVSYIAPFSKINR